MPFGTIRNPLTLGASGQSDGSAYRALAESLASQQMQAGPSSGLNVLQAILGPLAQVANMNRAAEADSAYEQNRMKQYEEFQARQAEQERAQQTAAAAGQRAEREKVADANGLTGLVRAQFLMTGEIPSQAFKGPEQPKRYEVGGALVDENGKVLFQAPKEARAPGATAEKIAQMRALGMSDAQIQQALIGGGAQQAPSGYRPTQDGSGLEAIPGGPADPANKPPTIAPEVAARTALTGEFLDNAASIRERIASGDMTGPVDFATAQIGYGQQGETRRQMLSGVDALRRGLTGAGMSQAEAGDYVERYLPAPQDNAETLLSKFDQLTEELTRYKANMEQGRTPLRQPTAGAPKRRRYNPQTDTFE